MAEGSKTNRSKSSSAISSQSQVAADSPADRDSGLWIREDGAVCVGNECIVISQHKGSKDLEIEINPEACGPPGEDLIKALMGSVVKGGKTHFVIESSLEER